MDFTSRAVLIIMVKSISSIETYNLILLIIIIKGYVVRYVRTSPTVCEWLNFATNLKEISIIITNDKKYYGKCSSSTYVQHPQTRKMLKLTQIIARKKVSFR